MKKMLINTKTTLQQEIRNLRINNTNSESREINESLQDVLDDKNGKIDELEEELKEYQGHLNQ